VRFRFHAWQLVVLLSAACAAAVAGLHWSRARGASAPAELVSFLPTANAGVVYIDVDAIRRSGVLNMLAGSKAAEEIEYKQFVDATLFDYRKDLDALGAAFQASETFFVLRGKFHWKRLMEYARAQGGACDRDYCVVAGSRPSRRISFYPLRPDVLAMAISADERAAYRIAPRSGKLGTLTPTQPVWALLPVVGMKDSDAVPESAKPYVSALRNTEQVLFTIGGESDRLELTLDATCRDPLTASRLLVDLESATSTLRSWMERERKPLDPADLTAVLLAGSFRREDRRVYGRWPVPRAFVDAIAGGSY
jgi:hypothetical protein